MSFTINLIATKAINALAIGIFTPKNEGFEPFLPFLSVLRIKGSV